jgi:hypothetical protein
MTLTLFTTAPASPAAKLWTPRLGAQGAAAALERGGRVIGLTMGQFSMLDLLGALLERTGPAAVRLSTWTVGIRDAENAGWMLDNGRMTSFQLFVDKSFPTRQPAYCAAVQRIFGARAINASEIHAKVATIHGDGWRLAVRASMNLNANPRCEQYDVDDDAGIAGFFDAHFDLLAAHGRPNLPAVSNREVDAIFERIRRGVNPFAVPARVELEAVGVQFGPTFGEWVDAKLAERNRAKAPPRNLAQLARSCGLPVADAADAIERGDGAECEDMAAVLVGANAREG